MKRIVLLGASNLTSGFPIACRLAASGWGPGPFRILAAAGHGRAYGVGSTVLGRGLPAIGECALWRELGHGTDQPTRALVADAGNDLAYGQSVGETVAAIRGCLERLRAAGAATVVVLPPVRSLERLTPARFVLLRSVLFPRRRFGLAPILDGLRRLAGELRGLAAEHEATVVDPDPAWFGVDRIHLKLRYRPAAWALLLAALGPQPAATAATLPPVRWRFLSAHRADLLGLHLHRSQPARRLPDGTTVSFY